MSAAAAEAADAAAAAAESADDAAAAESAEYESIAATARPATGLQRFATAQIAPAEAGSAKRSVLRKTMDTMFDQSEAICYLVIIINHLVNGGISSMLLCFSCFLYSMIQRPRADHRYWHAVIWYCTGMIVLRILVSLPTFVPNVAFYGNITADTQCARDYTTISCGSNTTFYCDQNPENCYPCSETSLVYDHSPLVLGLKKYDSIHGLVLSILCELMIIFVGGFHAGVCEYRGQHQCHEVISPAHKEAFGVLSLSRTDSSDKNEDGLGNGWVEHEEVLSSITILVWHSLQMELSQKQLYHLLVKHTQLRLRQWLIGFANRAMQPTAKAQTCEAVLQLFDVCNQFVDPAHVEDGPPGDWDKHVDWVTVAQQQDLEQRLKSKVEQAALQSEEAAHSELDHNPISLAEDNDQLYQEFTDSALEGLHSQASSGGDQFKSPREFVWSDVHGSQSEMEGSAAERSMVRNQVII